MITSSLRILAYHRVVDPAASPAPNPALVSASPADFERQMRHLARHYRVVSLPEALEAHRRNAMLPRRAVLLTFDDAYRDFGEVAWPILRRHGLPATLCVPTAYPDHPELAFWWDRVHHAIQSARATEVRLPPFGTLRLGTEAGRAAALHAVQGKVKALPHARAMELVELLCGEVGAEPPPAGEVLGWDALRALAADGVSLVPHTRTHPALTRVDPGTAELEIRGSAEDLTREIGSVLPVLCYPFGLHDAGAVAAAERAGVELALTCLDGHNRWPAAAPLRLRRTVVTRRTSPAILTLRLRKTVAYLDMWRHRGSAPVPPRAEPVLQGLEIAARPGGEPRVAYIMSRFPKLSETFVLNEILTLESMGLGVEIFPLLRERQPVSHPEVERLVRRAHFHWFLSMPVLRAQAHFLGRAPAAYFGALTEVLSGTYGSANYFFGALAIFPKCARIALDAQRLGVTHVHAHFCNHPATGALIVHRLTGIPYSFTAHGSDLHVDRRMLGTKVDAAAFAVTISDFNREVMVRECGEHAREKIRVVRCGVDPDYFAAARASARGGTFQIVCVASLEEVKGHVYLIEACRILRDRGRSFRCHLVGDGPRRRAIEARIERIGLRNHVQLHGAQPRPVVAKLLLGAHAAVLTSHPTADGRREGIPVALMEAMATGLPVVASNISGIPELVEDRVTGFLVPSGEPAAIANALELLIRDGALRQRMGAAGREKVLREYDLRANARGLVQLFRDGGAPAAAPEGPATLPIAVV